jgi:hypothetical protein
MKDAIITGAVERSPIFVIWGMICLIIAVIGFVVQIEVMEPYAELGDIRNAVGLPFFRLMALLIYSMCVTVAIAF